MTQSPQYHDLELDGTIYRRDDGPLGELLRELRKERFKDFASLPQQPPEPPKPRKPRAPSISKMIERAEKATGKAVTAITLPDGTKLDFTTDQQPNAVDEWMAKHARAPERH
jgi:hypothetical protein